VTVASACVPFAIASTLSLAVPASAQDYGGGWALPSLDTASMIGQQVVASELGVRAAGGTRGRRIDMAGATTGQSAAASTSVFLSALQPDSGDVPAVETSFSRSKTLQKQSEAAILAEVKRRQPGAESEYARAFAQEDMAKMFDRATSAYGLRNNDIADTMAAYWLVSWVIANDAKDFSPAAARAVRDQVKGGIARTSVAGFSAEKKHRLADEAIFNTLIATQAFEYAQSGKISKADYRRLADVTQQAFMGFGADLRALKLTEAGFVAK
jgi:hypothetical protein